MTYSWLRHRVIDSDSRLVGGYWAVVAPVLVLQYVADTGWNWWQVLPVVAVTVLLDTAMVAVLVERLLPLFLSKHWWRGLAQLPLLLLLSGGLYLLLYGNLLGHHIDLSGWRIVLGVVAHAKSYGLLAVLLTGKRYVELQQKLLHARQAQTESELRNLKAQLDPHFLFNNLNVLRGLIQQDPAEAHEFLNRFAALYRFLIRYKDEDVVSLSEEMQFAREYVYLLRHRFGEAYAFREEIADTVDLQQLLVVPGTLQLLVENAIKHNAGDDENPLLITIAVTATTLTVSHLCRPKLTVVESMGTGLPNLRERYRLLFGCSIDIAPGPSAFAVTIPVVALREIRTAA